MDHRLFVKLVFEGRALTPFLLTGEPARLGVLGGLGLAELVGRPRHLLALLAEEAAIEHFNVLQCRGELPHQLGDPRL